jgi:hypothetical protein
MNKIFLLLALFIHLNVSASSNSLRCSLLFVKNKINYLLTQPLAPSSLKNSEINLQEIAKVRDMPESELKYEPTFTFSLGLIERIKKEKGLTLDVGKYLEDASFIKKWTTYLSFLVASKTQGKVLSQDEVVMSLYKTMYLFQVKDQLDEWTFFNPYTVKMKVFWNDEKVGLYIKQIIEEQLIHNGLKSFSFFVESSIQTRLSNVGMRKYIDYFFKNTFNYISLYSYFSSQSPLFISLPYIKFDILSSKIKEVMLAGASQKNIDEAIVLLEERGLKSELNKEVKKSVAVNLIRDMFNKFMFGLMVYLIQEDALSHHELNDVKYNHIADMLNKESLDTTSSRFKEIFEAEFKRAPNQEDSQIVESLLSDKKLQNSLDEINYSLVVTTIYSAPSKIEVGLDSPEFMKIFKEYFGRNANQDDVDRILKEINEIDTK